MMKKIDWVEIPEGEFIFGLSEDHARQFKKLMKLANPDTSSGHFDAMLAREVPQRVVHVPTFYISRFPITWAQITEYFESKDIEVNYPGRDNISRFEREPARSNWHTARYFCHGLDARLPSSFEWEKAARGTDGRLYPWGNEWDINKGNFDPRNNRAVANEYGRRDKDTPVDAYPEGASPYGVMDMMGNLAEWTMTHYLSQQAYDLKNRPDRYAQLITIRGKPVGRGRPENISAVYRVTSISPGGVTRNSYHPRTGFRPVKDEFQMQVWPVT